MMQSIPEVAAALEVSERTVRRIIKQHNIPTSTLKRETTTGTRSYTAVSFDAVQHHLQRVATDEAPSSGLTYRERTCGNSGVFGGRSARCARAYA